MDPNSSSPWRILDTPSEVAGAAPGRETTTNLGAGPGLPAGSGRVIAAGLATAACAVLAIVLAVGGSGSGAVLVEGGGVLPLGSPGAASAPGSAAALGPDALGDTAEIIVEIVGAVPRPGVFRLAAGSRIADLVALAGGYGTRIDTARAALELKLASVLHDGEQVRVPSRDDTDPAIAGSPGVAGADSSSGPSGPTSLNLATQAQLEELPGVGPVTAQKILTAREEAPFTSIDELRSRGLVGEKTLENLRELVAVP